MTAQELLIFLLIGLVAGFVASRILESSRFGILGDLVVGVLGSFIGGWVFRLLGVFVEGYVGSVLTAFVGAVLLLVVLHIFKLR